MKNKPETIAIIGAGRLGQAIAKGLVASKLYNPSEIILTKRDVSSLDEFESNGYQVTSENELAIKKSEVLIFSVGPRDLETDSSFLASYVSADLTRVIFRDSNNSELKGGPNLAKKRTKRRTKFFP